MKKRLLQFIVLSVMLSFGAAAVKAQSDAVLAEIDRYAEALRKFERQKGRRSVEPVFRLGQTAGEKLVEVLESLGEADYARAQSRMKGYSLNRNEIIYAAPEIKFFKNLARTGGTPTDAAFFVLLGEYKPDGVWQAFYEQQTDVTACTRYGAGVLTKLYGKAKNFKKRYPSAYAIEIDEMTDEIGRQLTDGTCACGDRASAAREFRLFIKTFPAAQITPAVKKRLKQIETKKTEIRFACQSG